MTSSSEVHALNVGTDAAVARPKFLKASTENSRPVRMVPAERRLSYGQLAIRWGVTKQRAHAICRRAMERAAER